MQAVVLLRPKRNELRVRECMGSSKEYLSILVRYWSARAITGLSMSDLFSQC